LQETQAKKFRSLRSFLLWRLEMEKKGGSSMSKWKINAMSAYVNSITPRDQRQAAGIGHDERLVLVPHPPPEDCIDLDDPPVQLPNKLSESGEAESDNPFTSTPSEKAPEQDGTPPGPCTDSEHTHHKFRGADSSSSAPPASPLRMSGGCDGVSAMATAGMAAGLRLRGGMRLFTHNILTSPVNGIEACPRPAACASMQRHGLSVHMLRPVAC
jgi:hypothetical protein